MAHGNAARKASKEGKRGRNRSLKKINDELERMRTYILPFAEPEAEIRLMFEDEAGFGRINKPKRCWCPKGIRPSVPCHHIREYRYAYGAVEPLTGDSCFLVLPYTNTDCMNIFLKELSAQFAKDYILLAVDGASWHKSKSLVIPDNIRLFLLPAYTPEMNPTEQIWQEIRKIGFHNEAFSTLNLVMERLCDTIMSLSNSTIKSITGREWIVSLF
jgi:putative transposase